MNFFFETAWRERESGEVVSEFTEMGLLVLPTLFEDWTWEG